LSKNEDAAAESISIGFRRSHNSSGGKNESHAGEMLEVKLQRSTEFYISYPSRHGGVRLPVVDNI